MEPIYMITIYYCDKKFKKKIVYTGSCYNNN